jgi:hypothetical protein
MSWLITGVGVPFDNDAWGYISRVEAADGQILEQPVRNAITNFVIGCKTDGIWTAIKASCILSGARTLSGALVPLVGTAPTNFNFVSGDYNRKTGLVGNGSTKYLNSNRADNADPQNSIHLSVYCSSISTGAANYYIGSGIYTHIRTGNARNRNNITDLSFIDATGFKGTSRNNSASFSFRVSSSTTSASLSSSAGTSQDHHVFKRADINGQYIDARLSFYSIGESLDLALLDARVTTLMNALAAAIP